MWIIQRKLVSFLKNKWSTFTAVKNKVEGKKKNKCICDLAKLMIFVVNRMNTTSKLKIDS